jgi:hypothetical protein
MELDREAFTKPSRPTNKKSVQTHLAKSHRASLDDVLQVNVQRRAEEGDVRHDDVDLVDDISRRANIISPCHLLKKAILDVLCILERATLGAPGKRLVEQIHVAGPRNLECLQRKEEQTVRLGLLHQEDVLEGPIDVVPQHRIKTVRKCAIIQLLASEDLPDLFGRHPDNRRKHLHKTNMSKSEKVELRRTYTKMRVEHRPQVCKLERGLAAEDGGRDRDVLQVVDDYGMSRNSQPASFHYLHVVFENVDLGLVLEPVCREMRIVVVEDLGLTHITSRRCDVALVVFGDDLVVLVLGRQGANLCSLIRTQSIKMLL